jgi:hypothetical protein
LWAVADLKIAAVIERAHQTARAEVASGGSGILADRQNELKDCT